MHCNTVLYIHDVPDSKFEALTGLMEDGHKERSGDNYKYRVGRILLGSAELVLFTELKRKEENDKDQESPDDQRWRLTPA